ncbi:mannitol dehydrogenase family protein [Curtobacterium pusillum]|uniref:Mannitol-1-phosphate 5-dehydrogenase n=1 Tax=Curtobacterium pusillum TaxID=69373 RepID=A0ABX2M305_9MICO|nr:mannitol dehydrogenase family protein [Curtobacterium pusillum]NUU12522.1 mannitol dehydrogenase family protein [Curtobacterium pusillum]GLK33033.1 mannitol dehydrogenase [Curtobacterium pusillum]
MTAEAPVRRRLARSAAPAPIRIVHLGVGAFHRAHQAWYTAAVDADHQWGIAGFTGRSATVAEQLAPQGGLFTLIERSASGDTATVVDSIVEVNDGAETDRLVELLAAEPTAIVTLTITESGYRLGADGTPDLGDEQVAHDLEVLGSRIASSGDVLAAGVHEPLRTVLGRLVLGLAARRRAGAAGLAIVPCDNVPDNGAWVATGVRAFAAAVSRDLDEWIDANVAFVSTSVDRITPRTRDEDLETAAALTGYQDASPVVTEPFHDWILSGAFPGGRPAWENAGARFVADIEPFERRKLWLLNGAHSLLAYHGQLRGHSTVAEAVGDPECTGAMTAFWDEAVAHLDADELRLDDYRAALLDRFGNARIEHRLEQIAMEGTAKLRVRLAPVYLAERAAGRSGAAALTGIAAWIALLESGAEIPDAQASTVRAALAESGPLRVERLLQAIDDRIADTDTAVRTQAAVDLLKASGNRLPNVLASA